MGLKDILVHVATEDGEAATARTAYALALAGRFNAHLTGLVMALQPTMPPMVMGEVPGTLLESQRKSSIDAADQAGASFVAAAERAGVSFERRSIECPESTATTVFATYARVTDLVITGQSDPDDYVGMNELLIESALFDSGRPVLIVPHRMRAPARLDRVLVAWNGGREAARAVHDALPLICAAGTAEIVVVGKGVAVAGDGEPGQDIASHLARHGCAVSITHLDSGTTTIASTILSYAADVDGDLIVMGGYGHSRLRQMVMGGVTRGILQSMAVPVLMSH